MTITLGSSLPLAGSSLALSAARPDPARTRTAAAHRGSQYQSARFTVGSLVRRRGKSADRLAPPARRRGRNGSGPVWCSIRSGAAGSPVALFLPPLPAVLVLVLVLF